MENKKRRIGIITIYYRNFNYGGLLQAYALAEFLNKKMDQQAEQISYASMPKKKSFADKWDLIKGFSLKCLLGKAIIKADILIRTIVKPNISDKFTERKRQCNLFRNRIPHSPEVKDNMLKTLNKEYDVFIAGSDQIWNPNTSVNPYFLDFVDSGKKKIAFAASLGVNGLSNRQKKRITPLVSQFDFISVREKKAKEILMQCIPDREIEVVLDPVFLLGEKEWDRIANSLLKGRKYIYAYFLGEREKNIRLAKKNAEMLNMPIVTVPYIYRRYNGFDHKFGDIKLYDVGPCEFLGLIRDAEFVITDSFHATVFSVIYKKPFFVYDRDRDNDTNSMNSRLIDFLDELGLNSRRISHSVSLSGEKLEEKIDYQRVYSILEEKRIKSADFLSMALNGENREAQEQLNFK